MQNKIICLALWLLCFGAFAQIPSNYYTSANGLVGTALKTELNTIISGHTTFPYTSSSTDVWDILKQSDKDPNNPQNVILFYTGWSVNAAQEYASGSGWSREHVWAKSRGDFGTANGPGTDCHHLRPADISVNSARNNRWFQNAPTPYLDGGQPTGCNTSNIDWIWEPRDEVKGDVARMLFYMAVRYEGINGDIDLELTDTIPTDKNTKAPVHAVLSTLFEWHLNDTVDAFEKNRNEVVYSFQGNRNPFIDHPEYACLIWNNAACFTSDVGEDRPLNDEINIYPNPAMASVTIEGVAIDGRTTMDVYTANGVLVHRTQVYKNKINIEILPQGIYIVHFYDGEGLYRVKSLSKM